MANEYPEHKISDYIYTPEAGSTNHTTPCGHTLHFSAKTRVVVICPDCEVYLEKLMAKDSRCKKVVDPAQMKEALKLADDDERVEKEKEKSKTKYKIGEATKARLKDRITKKNK